MDSSVWPYRDGQRVDLLDDKVLGFAEMLRHNAHVGPHVVSAVAKWIARVAVTHHARPERAAALARGMRNDLQL